MNHIVEQIGAIVTAMQDLNGSPFYMYGHRLEINNRLLEKDAEPTQKNKKYPLIALRWETPEDVANGLVEYNLNIVFVTHTEKNYNAEQRQDNVIKPILTPIYEEFLRQIKISGLFTWEGNQKEPNHTKTDRPYWGVSQNEGNIANIFDDPLDGIEITNLKLKGRRYDGCEARIPIDNKVTVNINDVQMVRVNPYSTADLIVKDTEGLEVGSKIGSEWVVPAAGGGVALDIYVDEVFAAQEIIPSGTEQMNINVTVNVV